MEEATVRQSVHPESTSIWWWLTALIIIWKTPIEHSPWVKYYHILSYLTLSTIKGGYYFLPFCSWEKSLKEFQKLPQRLPPPKLSVKLSFKPRSSWWWTPSSWHLHGSETPEKSSSSQFCLYGLSHESSFYFKSKTLAQRVRKLANLLRMAI